VSQRKDGNKCMGKVRSTIRMLIPLKKQREALEILGAVISQVEYDPSCITSRLYRDVNEARAVMIEELWTSEEDMLCHLQSDAYHRVLLVIEMAEETPEIRFDTIMRSRGFETIENVRKNRITPASAGRL